MKKPLITVVVPVYNVEKYLDRCITSIVNQTYSNLEIILVDDGSPDNCPTMCDAWAGKDSRIRVVHKGNAGLGMARNTGIEQASGDYICFFDSDDYIALDALEKAYGLAETYCADIVVFGMSNVDKQGNVAAQHIPDPQQVCFQGSEVQQVFLPDLIDGRHCDARNKNLCLSACSCLFSMDLIRRTGWRFVSERRNISEDSYSLIWLYKYVSKVAVLPEALYYYCENETSLTRTYRPDRFEKIKDFYNECILMAEEQGYGEEVCVRIAGLFLSFSIAAMKQIAAAPMDNKQKKSLIRQIVLDTTMQQLIADPGCRYGGCARRVLLWGMRNRLCNMVCLILRLQICRKGK